MDFEDWLEYGVANGYITSPYCDTHDGIPVTPEELDKWDEGDDPCHHSVRLIAGHEELKQLARK